MYTLDISGDIALTDGTFRIIGGAGSLYRMQNLSTGVQTTEHLADIFPRLLEVPAWPTSTPRQLDSLEPRELADVQFWANHIEEMTSGVRPGHDSPRPQYDPAVTSLNERTNAKISELREQGQPACRSALLRKKTLYQTGGAAALIDRRTSKNVGKLDQADERVVDAIAEVAATYSNKSTVTESYLHTRVEKYLILQYGQDAPPLPSRASLYRYFKALTKGRHTTGKATTRRSAANTPKNRPYGTIRRLLPGEEVQVDSTPMEVMVRVKGVPGGMRPTLTVMIDRATRSVIASTIRLDAAKGYDHALLLTQALVPFQNRPDRSAHRALLAARHPEYTFLSTEQRLQLERSRPFIFPRRIVTDNGKDYLSSVFKSACRKYGIDITMSAIHTPTDKPHVERNFESIGTLFTQSLPGYLGNHTVNRGYKVEDDELLDIATLTELFDDWVVNVWQNRPHRGLRDPFEPTVLYSPNQAYNGAAAYSGVVAYPLSKDDFIELLPSADRVIGAVGVQFKNRHFDSAELQPYRLTPSRRPAKGSKWEVKFNPYDFTHVWVRSPSDTWIECSWREMGVIDLPHFSDIANATRVARRNEVARDDAHRAGVPMPSGNPADQAAEAIDITTTDLTPDAATPLAIASMPVESTDPAFPFVDYADFAFEEN
jgi:putative transposase